MPCTSVKSVSLLYSSQRYSTVFLFWKRCIVERRREMQTECVCRIFSFSPGTEVHKCHRMNYKREHHKFLLTERTISAQPGAY